MNREGWIAVGWFVAATLSAVSMGFRIAANNAVWSAWSGAMTVACIALGLVAADASQRGGGR